jgi:hypothetical protein
LTGLTLNKFGADPVAGSVTVRNCAVVPSESPPDHGLFVYADASVSIKIEGNYFQGWKTGLQVQSNDALYPLTKVVVSGNAFEDNKFAFLLDSANGPDVLVSGNRFISNFRHLWAFLSDGETVTVRGNDFLDPGNVEVSGERGSLILSDNYGEPPTYEPPIAEASTISVVSTSPTPHTNFPVVGP